MDLAIVQQNNQMTADLLKKMTQESLYLCALDAVLTQEAIERTSEAFGTDGTT